MGFFSPPARSPFGRRPLYPVDPVQFSLKDENPFLNYLAKITILSVIGVDSPCLLSPIQENFFAFLVYFNPIVSQRSVQWSTE